MDSELIAQIIVGQVNKITFINYVYKNSDIVSIISIQKIYIYIL